MSCFDDYEEKSKKRRSEYWDKQDEYYWKSAEKRLKSFYENEESSDKRVKRMKEHMDNDFEHGLQSMEENSRIFDDFQKGIFQSGLDGMLKSHQEALKNSEEEGRLFREFDKKLFQNEMDGFMKSVQSSSDKAEKDFWNTSTNDMNMTGSQKGKGLNLLTGIKNILTKK